METTWEDLAPGVIRRRLPGWDETVGAVAGSRCALLIDAGGSPEGAAGLRAAAEERLGVPVRHLVLTHPHFDHVLGAGALADAETYGAVGVGGWLAEGGRAELAADAERHGMPAADATPAAAELRRPAHEVSGELVVDLGGRRVVLANLGPAHTAHDLVVLVPDARVVFCGDLVEESGPPQAGPDAHPGWWPGALDRLLELGGPDAVYVPGHGAVVDAAFIRAQRAALARRFAAEEGAGGATA